MEEEAMLALRGPPPDPELGTLIPEMDLVVTSIEQLP